MPIGPNIIVPALCLVVSYVPLITAAYPSTGLLWKRNEHRGRFVAHARMHGEDQERKPMVEELPSGHEFQSHTYMWSFNEEPGSKKGHKVELFPSGLPPEFETNHLRLVMSRTCLMSAILVCTTLIVLATIACYRDVYQHWARQCTLAQDPPQASRDQSWDGVKFVLIFVVVLYHQSSRWSSLTDLPNAYKIRVDKSSLSMIPPSNREYSGCAEFIHQFLIGVVMTAFSLISGLFGCDLGDGGRFIFIWKKSIFIRTFQELVTPVLLIQYTVMLLEFLLGELLCHGELGFPEFFAYMMLNPLENYWYVWALVFWRLFVTPMELAWNRLGLPSILFAFVIAEIVFVALFFALSYSLMNSMTFRLGLYYTPWYALGLALSKKRFAWHDQLSQSNFVLVISAWIFLVGALVAVFAPQTYWYPATIQEPHPLQVLVTDDAVWYKANLLALPFFLMRLLLGTSAMVLLKRWIVLGSEKHGQVIEWLMAIPLARQASSLGRRSLRCYLLDGVLMVPLLPLTNLVEDKIGPTVLFILSVPYCWAFCLVSASPTVDTACKCLTCK